jgi:hypothetical protein
VQLQRLVDKQWGHIVHLSLEEKVRRHMREHAMLVLEEE